MESTQRTGTSKAPDKIFKVEHLNLFFSFLPAIHNLWSTFLTFSHSKKYFFIIVLSVRDFVIFFLALQSTGVLWMLFYEKFQLGQNAHPLSRPAQRDHLWLNARSIPFELLWCRVTDFTYLNLFSKTCRAKKTPFRLFHSQKLLITCLKSLKCFCHK